MNTSLAMLAGAVVMGAMAVSAQAQTLDDRAYFAFSAPVSIPGATLPAGEYIFRVVDWDTGGRVVQVLDRHALTPMGMFFTQTVRRPEPAGTAEVTLGEAPEGTARSIAAWWQPGEEWGRGFQYRDGEASWDQPRTPAPAAD
ncbi:MAG: hypothetical protein AB7N65_25575 [Vicinamibacterales bacterium]